MLLIHDLIAGVCSHWLGTSLCWPSKMSQPCLHANQFGCDDVIDVCHCLWMVVWWASRISPIKIAMQLFSWGEIDKSKNMDIRDQTLSHSKTNKHHDSQPTIYKGLLFGMDQLAEQYQTGSSPRFLCITTNNHSLPLCSACNTPLPSNRFSPSRSSRAS